MKENWKNFLRESFKDEVDIESEWLRLETSIRKLNYPITKRLKIRQISLILGRYAAAVLLGIIITTTFLCLKQKSEKIILQYSKVITEGNNKSFIELSDGSKIWLNRGTTIEYNQEFGLKNRNLKLKGEAYFEVAKNKKIPFIIKAGDIFVTAVGTSFNIKAYIKDSIITTTLYTGKVNVTSAVSGPKVLLSPNEMAIYYKGKNKIEKYSYAGTDKAEWLESNFSFNMVPFIEMTEQLEKQYNVTFIYKNQDIKKLRFSGSFRKGENLNDILNVIQTNTGINYKIENNRIIIN